MIVKILKIAAMTLLLSGLFSCAANKEETIPFVTIGSGQCGIWPKQEIIITSQEEWENFILPLPKSEIDRFSETEINFEEFQIIAAIDDIRPDSGWSMAITCIMEYSYFIVVTITVFADINGVSLSEERRPYYIVKIPASMKRIDFNIKH